MAKKMTRRKTSDKPKKDTTFTRKDEEFMKMCEWIEVEIFHYNIANKERLHRMACLRLQGLRKGKPIGNNKTEDFGDYSVECVFNTFKAYKEEILKAIKGKNFADESRKMAYICRIVENHLNDMAIRMKNAKASQEKQEYIDTQTQSSDTAEYQKQTAEVKNNTFEGIW